MFSTSRTLATSRTAVLVDLENAAASPIPTLHATQAVQVMVSSLVPDPEAHYIVATGTRSHIDVAFGWRGGRIWARGGQHGAELELLDRARHENLAGRYQEIMVVSGDGMFTDYVSELGRLGVTTTVVGWRHSMSRSLRMAAHHVVYFDSIMNVNIHNEHGADIA